MGLFSGRNTIGRATEERATYRAPQMPAVIGSYADVVVTPSTAAQSVAIRTTVDLIASLASELPINVYAGTRKDRRDARTPSELEDPGGDDRGREDWGYRLLWSWLLTGNNFGDIIDRDGHRLRTVDLFNPDDISANVIDGKPVFHVNGKEVDNLAAFAHWRVNPIAGRLLGLSPIEHHATTIGVSLATSRFGRQWFADGAHPSGYLTNTEVALTGTQAKDAKKIVLDARGSSEPMVFGKGWNWTNAQITPEESQFLQTQGLSEAQCARIFGPGLPEILGLSDSGSGGKVTYSNLVDRRQDVLVLSLNRWLRRYERILTKFVPRGQWVELNRDALLEATTLQRYQAHASALQNNWKTIDEVRDIENLDPVPWGKEPFAQKSGGAPAPTQQEADDESDPGD